MSLLTRSVILCDSVALVVVRVNSCRYCALMTQPDWPAWVATVVASQVKRYRKARGMSAQQVADACSALGYPLQRSVLANFESGRRATVTVAELLVLAKVLGVAPILLIYPLGTEPTTEALPGEHRRVWDALKWFTGSASFPAADADPRPDPFKGTPEDDRAWGVNSAALMLHENHDHQVVSWLWENGRVELVKNEDHLQDIRKRLADIERELAQLRKTMREQGFIPPPLPADLARLIGEPDFVVYERFENPDGTGQLVERRAVDTGSAEDYQLAAAPDWRWLALPFKSRPKDFVRGDSDSEPEEAP